MLPSSMRGRSSLLPGTSPISSRHALGAIGPLSAPPGCMVSSIVFDEGSGKRDSSPSFSRLLEGVLTEGTVGSGLSTFWSVADSQPFRRRSPCLLPSPSSLFRPASKREGRCSTSRGSLPPKGEGRRFRPDRSPLPLCPGRQPVGEKEDQSINVTPWEDDPESYQRCASHSFFPKARRTL